MAHFAPRAALRRAEAHTRYTALMNYDGASRGRRTKGWKAPASSADAAGYGSRRRLRQLSRDLVRNAPFAARAQHLITNNVVGGGFVPSINGAEDPQLRAVLDTHLGTTAIDAMGLNDLAACQRIAMNAVFESGELLVRRRMRLKSDGLTLPFQIELLEPDYLDETKQWNGGNEVIEGIEFDPWGRVVAYWLYDQHPGDVSRTINTKSRRYAAPEILHLRKLDRPGQARGVPWMAPVILTLGEMRDYQEAQITKQRMAALMAFFVESESDAGASRGTGASALDDIGPGAIIELATGQKVTATEPPKVDGYDQFMKQGLSAIASGLGLTYEALSGDLSGVNFSSARMGRMEMNRNIEVWQGHIIRAQFLTGIERWMREAWLLNFGKAADWQLSWTAPRPQLVDPTREIPAMVKEISAGLNSRHGVIRSLGRDPETIDAELQADTFSTAGEIDGE
ncbi:phage portal protein, lambda family [Monaibacterium marinum]|uniref:Phage portal protein, lambda family n=2 Tax=Pontivivens marinum TaxID=1690039 RepID=A0A2C9CQ83_9RHOB|nr:phage portal protein, lambda family [Monaibacterium marinum]